MNNKWCNSHHIKGYELLDIVFFFIYETSLTLQPDYAKKT